VEVGNSLEFLERILNTESVKTIVFLTLWIATVAISFYFGRNSVTTTTSTTSRPVISNGDASSELEPYITRIPADEVNAHMRHLLENPPKQQKIKTKPADFIKPVAESVIELGDDNSPFSKVLENIENQDTLSYLLDLYYPEGNESISEENKERLRGLLEPSS